MTINTPTKAGLFIPPWFTIFSFTRCSDSKGLPVNPDTRHCRAGLGEVPCSRLQVVVGTLRLQPSLGWESNTLNLNAILAVFLTDGALTDAFIHSNVPSVYLVRNEKS